MTLLDYFFAFLGGVAVGVPFAIYEFVTGRWKK